METLGLLYSCLFQFLLHFPSLFIKSIQFFKCIKQNSWQIFFFSQNLKFFKISPWNFIFSSKFKLSPLCMNEEKWKKCWEIKLGLRVTLEQGVQIKLISNQNEFKSYFIVLKVPWKSLQVTTVEQRKSSSQRRGHTLMKTDFQYAWEQKFSGEFMQLLYGEPPYICDSLNMYLLKSHHNS